MLQSTEKKNQIYLVQNTLQLYNMLYRRRFSVEHSQLIKKLIQSSSEIKLQIYLIETASLFTKY